MGEPTSRRCFLERAGRSSFALAAGAQLVFAAQEDAPEAAKKWQPISDRKVRVGIVGHGRCRFGAQFFYQDHPNVEVVAVSDLIKERCDAMSKMIRCEKTYPSHADMLKDDTIEAIYLATDAPSHAQQAIDTLKRGKHVVCAVPAVWGSLEDAARLYDAVKSSGKIYQLNETSAFHDDTCAMRALYRAGAFGKVIYTEGEYFHYMPEPFESYKEWRVGLPPQWYPTHSNGYYHCVTGGQFTEVSCMGMPSTIAQFQPDNNRYKNPFGTEIALFRTTEGGMARMAVSWDSQGVYGEVGRVRGERGGKWNAPYAGDMKKLPDLTPPPLPPSVKAGGHGGSHGRLTDEFISAILQNRPSLIDVSLALNMTVAGVIAHQSALKNGETIKVPTCEAVKLG